MELAGLLIPVVIVGLAATMLGVVITFARNYVKCAPNEVLVVFGKKKGDKGYRLITGGATFVWPVFEAYQRISLDTPPRGRRCLRWTRAAAPRPREPGCARPGRDTARRWRN